MAKNATAKAKSVAKQSGDLPWTAADIELRDLDALTAYPNNPRTHSAEQIDQIVASMVEFGWTQPMIVDEDGMILAGHGRAMAARQLGLDQVPVVVRPGLSESQKRAIVIADNQIPQNAGWDEKLLRIEIKELKKSGFDLNLLAFPELKLVEFTALPGSAAGGAEEGQRELTDKEAKLMDDAWAVLVRDWHWILSSRESMAANHFVSSNFTKGALAVHFLRARFFERSIPSAATLAYTPHRVDVNGDKKGSLIDLMKRATTPEILRSIQFVAQMEPRLDKLLLSSLAIHGHRIPGEFPSDLARQLIDEFASKPKSRVLDPCHGWGGRALGFMLSKKAEHYEGFDTDPLTHSGVNDMLNDLLPFSERVRTWRTQNIPFQRAELEDASFDFALTSPPYFNVEKYNGKESSWREFKTFDEWCDGFYGPMIVKVAAALKPHAAFALQIGNQSYPLEEKAKEIAATCGLEYSETRSTSMINNYNKTEKLDGEVVVIFSKKKTPR